MGLGGTAKKLQKVVDMADELYNKLAEMRQQLVDIKETIERTDDRVESLESDVAAQQELLEAIAEANDVDIPDDLGESDDDIEGEGNSSEDSVEKTE